MGLDRLGTHEELGRRFAICGAFRDHEGHLELLWGQLVTGVRNPAARPLAARGELPPRSVRPGSGAEAIEGLERGPQLSSRVGAPSPTAQPLTEAELRPCPVEG